MRLYCSSARRFALRSRGRLAGVAVPALVISATSLIALGPAYPQVAGQEQSAPARGLTLNECYALALSASEDDRIRAADMAAAQARYRQSVGGIFPRAALFLNKTYEDREDENRIGATNRGLLGQGRPAGVIFENPLRAGMSVSWPLFGGFRSYYEAEAGQHDLRRLTLERRRFRELLSGRVRRLLSGVAVRGRRIDSGRPDPRPERAHW